MALSASDIKNIRALQQKKNRFETGLFLVEGPKTVRELINSKFKLERIYTTESFDFLSNLEEGVVQLINERELARISGLKTPNKLLAVAKIPSVAEVDMNQAIIMVLDGINDPGNLGTIIRTSKWFGISTILCSKNCADTFDRKVVQSSMGALFHTTLHYCSLPETLAYLKVNGFRVLGAAMSGTALNAVGATPKTVLVIGSESHGISPEVLELCDQVITIPNLEKDRKVESLNASVATSIILYQLALPSTH